MVQGSEHDAPESLNSQRIDGYGRLDTAPAVQLTPPPFKQPGEASWFPLISP